MMNVPQSWDLTRGAGAVIAVQDTGIREHEYFEDRDVMPRIGPGRGHGTQGTAMSDAALSIAPEVTLMPLQSTSDVAFAHGSDGIMSEQIVEPADLWPNSKDTHRLGDDVPAFALRFTFTNVADKPLETAPVFRHSQGGRQLHRT